MRVRYAETDQMGMVYHSHYLIWFEVGRVEALRRLGFVYREMEKDGCHLPVVEVRCRYKAPARYDDEILVRTSLKNVRAGMIHFFYEIWRAGSGSPPESANGALLLAEGETVHFCVDHQGNRCNFPDKPLRALKAAIAR